MLQCGRSLISGNITSNISQEILSFLLIRVLLFFKLVPVSCIDPSADENFGDDMADVDVSGYGGVVGDGEPDVPLWELDKWLRKAGCCCCIMILNDLFPL